MALVDDFQLVAEESRPLQRNQTMRDAINFAHFLRRVTGDVDWDVVTLADKQELVAWWHKYEHLGRDTFLNTIDNIREVRRLVVQDRYIAWTRRYDEYLTRLRAKEVSSEIAWRRRHAWERRNPAPRQIARQGQRVMFCDHCEEPQFSGFMSRVRADLCNACFAEHFRRCDRCGLVYHRDEYHYHPPPPKHDSECRAPRERFRMPNKLLKCGYQPSDRIVHVKTEIASGSIPTSAMMAITKVVNSERPSWDHIAYATVKLLAGGNAWETSAGKFPKRLANAIYKNYHWKLSPNKVAAIGNVARQNMMNSHEQFVEFTRNLNRPRELFRNDNSCWWTSFPRARCILKQSHGMGMRLFSGMNEHDGVSARAWVIPLDENLVPVEDPMNAQAWLLFNSYGMSSQELSSLLSMMVGKQCISIVAFGNSGLSINGDSAYLITDKPYLDTNIQLPFDNRSIACSCITWGEDVVFPYEYDDSDFSPVTVGSEPKFYEDEEEEPDDDPSAGAGIHVQIADNWRDYDIDDEEPDDF